MISFGSAIFVCWVIYYTYWVLSALQTKPTQEVTWDTGSVWWNCGIFVVFFLIKNVVLIIPHSVILNIVSLFSVMIGLIIAIVARYSLSDNWSKDVVLKKNHTLITKGIYTYIRHPIYSGYLLMGLGTVIFIGTFGVMALYSILAIFLLIKLEKEEDLLRNHFGKEYKDYQKVSKKLIPFIF
jgi:protein-S-isoprenylcysteine O-methyltransferase Ste14